MSEKSINFDGRKIDKRNFYKNKKLFKIENIDINKILVSKENDMVKKIHLIQKTSIHFQCKKIPKENASDKCLSLMMLDSVIRANKK